MLQFIYPVDITIVLSFDEYLESPEDIKPEDASVFNVLIETRKDIHLIYASIDNTAKQYGSSEINNLQIQIHHNGMVFCSVQAFEEWYDKIYAAERGLFIESIQMNEKSFEYPDEKFVLTEADIKDY